MERVEQQVRNEWKLLLSAAMAALSSYMQQIALPLLILLGVMILDYVAGITKAWINGELSSRKSVEGAARKLGRLGLVAVGMAVDFIASTGLEAIEIQIPVQMPVALLVCFWIILGECISIVENLDAAGVPIPAFLRNALQEGKHSIDNLKEDDEHESD